MPELLRVIGCGNRARGDDAAGILVAERLRELGVEAESLSGETTALLEAWRGSDEVIVVDAVVSGAPCGTVHVWDSPQPLALGGFPASTHGMGVLEAINLARTLGCLPRRLRLYGIEARQFSFGGALSPELLGAVEKVVKQILRQAHWCAGKASEPRASTHKQGGCPKIRDCVAAEVRRLNPARIRR
jgi:hydrogenase maturation protease